MLQQPSYRPYRKAFKGRIGSGFHRGQLAYGQWGLRAMEGGRLTARQLEAGRRALRRSLQREGLVWTRQFPDIPISGKPSEVRRGKGKGAVSYWAARIRPGHIIFEVALAGATGISSGETESGSTIVVRALEKAGSKLPRRCRVITSGRLTLKSLKLGPLMVQLILSCL